jgi:hypothetical protein
MAKKSNAENVVVIERKKPFDWGSMKAKAEQEHWRKLRVVIKLREKMHAGKPAQLDAANAMLKARGLEEVVEAREAVRPVEERAEEIIDEGLCEFHRREGKPGIWWPSNHFKACIKENWSVLGYRVEHRGSRGALAEGVFVCGIDPNDRDWISLGDSPDGIDQNVSHTVGPRGPQSSIKRNEFIVGRQFECEVWIANAIAMKLPDAAFADMLLHAQEHGIGANRSQGIGKFDILDVQEITQ